MRQRVFLVVFDHVGNRPERQRLREAVIAITEEDANQLIRASFPAGQQRQQQCQNTRLRSMRVILGQCKRACASQQQRNAGPTTHALLC